MGIFVIVLNWNGKNDTLSCLSSLQKVETPHEVVVVDNGSTDGSGSAISHSFPEAHLIQTGENLGYAEGNNVGVRCALAAGASSILLLNNDTIVDPYILEAFLEQDLPLQGGKPLLMDDPDTLDHLGGRWSSERGEFSLVGQGTKAREWSEPLPLDYVCGVALFAKKEVFERVGLLDPRFFLFWEESDFCFRAKKWGYQPTFCPKACLYHKVSASFTGGKPHTTYFWWRNRSLWIEKNCGAEERALLFKKIRREFFHIFKLFLLRSLQQVCTKKTGRRTLRLALYKSQLMGLRDFYRGRFGNAPSSLFEK